jgi:hypothetical protein
VGHTGPRGDERLMHAGVRNDQGVSLLPARAQSLSSACCAENERSLCEWIYRVLANPGSGVGGVLPPSPVLAPGSALGSRPRVALSSAQVIRV